MSRVLADDHGTMDATKHGSELSSRWVLGFDLNAS